MENIALKLTRMTVLENTSITDDIKRVFIWSFIFAVKGYVVDLFKYPSSNQVINYGLGSVT